MNVRPSKPMTRVAGLVAGAALLLAACSAGATTAPSATPSGAASAAPSAAASGQASVVNEVQDAKLGAYLTGAGGKTLYEYKGDSAGKSACTGQCATNWPPLTLASGETATAGSGVTGTLATITRDDGSTQVTYNGAPLYYFAGDKKAGDTSGEGIKSVWYVAPVTGTVETAAASPASGSGGYGSYGGGSSPAPSAAAAGSAEAIVDYGFQPSSLTVKAGTTVAWTNTGAVAHTVTADDASFDSGTVASGSTFTHTFSSAGTFAFHCSIHPSMTGTIVVTP